MKKYISILLVILLGAYPIQSFAQQLDFDKIVRFPLLAVKQPSKPLKKALDKYEKAIRKKSLKERDDATAAFMKIIDVDTEESSIIYCKLGELHSFYSPPQIQDLSKAMQFYLDAESVAATPEIKANILYNIGLFYYHGKPVACDYAKAEELFLQAAQINEAYYYPLGEMYDLGFNKEADTGKAIEFYYRAAVGGAKIAWPRLFYIKYVTEQKEANKLDTISDQLFRNYMIEGSIKDNKRTAMKHLVKASRRGYIPAFYELSCIESNGYPIPTNISLKWQKVVSQRSGYITQLDYYKLDDFLQGYTYIYFADSRIEQYIIKGTQLCSPLDIKYIGTCYCSPNSNLPRHYGLARACYHHAKLQGLDTEEIQQREKFLVEYSCPNELPPQLKATNIFYSIRNLLSVGLIHQSDLHPLNDQYAFGEFWVKRYTAMEQAIKEEWDYHSTIISNKSCGPLKTIGENDLQIPRLQTQAWQKDMVFFRQMAARYGKAITPSVYETKEFLTLLKETP